MTYEPGDPHDGRLNQAWGLLCRRELEEHPERKDATEGMSAFAAFCHGWHYRYEAAAQELIGGDSDPQMTLIRDQFDFLLAQYKRAWREVHKTMDASRWRRKLLADQAHMIKEARLNPLDAPAWRRISEQRKEIKRLTREVQLLKGQLVEASVSSGPES